MAIDLLDEKLETSTDALVRIINSFCNLYEDGHISKDDFWKDYSVGYDFVWGPDGPNDKVGLPTMSFEIEPKGPDQEAVEFAQLNGLVVNPGTIRIWLTFIPENLKKLKDRRIVAHAEKYSHDLAYAILNMTEGRKRADQWLEQANMGHTRKKSGQKSLGFKIPKNERLYKRWVGAYRQICKIQREFHRDYNAGETHMPEPRLDDYRDALNNKLKWKPSAKTVSHIIQAGEAGHLKKRS